MCPPRDSESGDREERFRGLFERYFRPVASFFARRGFSSEESRDLAQETFFRVYRGMRGYRQEARIETWLFKIATHIYLNELRYQAAGKRMRQEISLDEAWEQGLPVFGPPGSGNPSGGERPDSQLDAILADERTRKLKEAIAELPPKMRRCVLLRIDQGLKYREIALVTRVSIQTVRAQLHQARKRLKEKLGDYFGELELPCAGGEDDG